MKKTLITGLMLSVLFPVLPLQAATIAKPATASGLVAWWAFDDATGTVAGDSSGNFTNGTLTGSPVWTTGKRMGALQFSGSNYVTAGSIPQISGGTDWTVSFWMNSTSVSNYRNPFDASFLAGGNNAGPRFEQYSNNAFTPGGNFGMVVGVDLATYSILDLQTTIAPGRWYHVAASRTGNTVQAYIDGVRVVNQANTNWPASFSAVNIGRGYSTAAERAFQGKIDDVRIYSRALTTTEVSSLHRSGQVARKITNNNGLVGYWSFDEGTSTTAGDFSGRGYTGTLSGSSLPIWIKGKKGGALTFDTNRNYVETSQVSAFNMGSSDFTLAAFVKKNDNTGRAIFEKRGSGLLGYLFIIDYPSTGQAAIFLNDSMSGQKVYSFSSPGSMPVGTWFHAAVVVNRAGNTATFYNNGVAMQTVSTAATTGSIDGDGTLKIGYDLGGFSFNGSMDDVKIFTRALSSQDVAVLAKANQTKANAPQNTKATDGLVGYWTFNGKDVTTSIQDVSGQNNHGYFIGGATSTALTIGKVGQGIDFDGVNDSVRVTDPASGVLDFGAGQDFSIAYWRKPDGNPSESSHKVFSKKGTVDNNSAGYGVYGGNCLKIGDGTNNLYESCAGSGTTGEWTHVAFTISRTGNCTKYLNGVSVGANSCSAWSASDISNSSDLCIGSNVCANGWSTSGLDEFRIYNRSLSATEVKQLYLTGK